MKVKNNTNKIIQISSLIYKRLLDDPVKELYLKSNDENNIIELRNLSKIKFFIQLGKQPLIEIYSTDYGGGFDAGIFITSNWSTIDCEIGDHYNKELKTIVYDIVSARKVLDLNILTISDEEYFQYSTIHSLPPIEFIKEYAEYYDLFPEFMNNNFAAISNNYINYKELKLFLLSDKCKNILDNLFKFDYKEYEKLVNDLED